MLHRRLIVALVALLLSACGAQLPAAAPAVAALPTAAVAQLTTNRLPPTPNLALIDKAILDDLAATAQPTTTHAAAQATPTPRPTATHAAAQVKALPRPTPQPARRPTRLVIGDIGMDRQLIPVGLDKDTMPIVPKHDAGWFTGSAKPGQGENIVLWGHALRFRNASDIPAPFGRLSQLKLGAQIVLFDSEGASHAYTVTHQLWVTPDQVSYILPTGKERVTIVSCIGDEVIGSDGAVVDMTHRLITIAEPKA